MEIFGLGKKKAAYKFKKGDSVEYQGAIKKYQGKVFKVLSTDYDASIGNHYNVKGSDGKVHIFTEKVMKKHTKKGLGEGLGDIDGLGKAQNYTIQQVDEIAKQIQHDSGVKKRVTVKHYNISHKEAKKMAFAKVKTMSNKVRLKSVK